MPETNTVTPTATTTAPVVDRSQLVLEVAQLAVKREKHKGNDSRGAGLLLTFFGALAWTIGNHNFHAPGLVGIGFAFVVIGIAMFIAALDWPKRQKALDEQLTQAMARACESPNAEVRARELVILLDSAAKECDE